ncbi:MAG: UbiH/UbiF/VisC/COQ6 family ubiquinone biosynthesis hydroxylase [Mariprofundaceae bacterium]
MREKVDVAIIGGGMVGLTLACALRHTTLRVVVLERCWPEMRQSLDFDMRASAIVAGGVRILQGLDIWDALKGHAGDIRAMRVWADQGFGAIRFEAEEIGLDRLGVIVENSRIHEALLDVAEAADNIELCCPAEVERCDITAPHVSLYVNGDTVYETALVVGADGANSWLRAQAGIDTWGHSYEQKGLVATVKPRQSHRGTAFQRFLPGGPLALLPLPDGFSSIVWSLPRAEADVMMIMDDDEFLAGLNRAFGPMLGGIERAGARGAFPLRLQHARHIVRPRLAFVGDAAHVVHPLAGLGVNLGLRDAMVLAQELADARRFDEDPGGMDVLRRYIRKRAPDTLAVMGATEALHRLFTGMPWLSGLRDAGMLAVGNSGALKRILMRTSMGLTQPVPSRVL